MEGSNRTRTEELNELKSTLVNDVFSKDNEGKVPMDKVMILIWLFRDDPTVVQFMAHFVTKYAGRRDVFDGIEFYLPQLAHMIIHLEVHWDDAILERFALIIAQQSLHFALQLNWILQGAIEDYQPEMPNGEVNEGYNALYYSRCVKLLGNIERCVVYGSPRTHELQRLYEKGQITKEEYEILEQADRKYNAAQLISRPNLGEDAGRNPFGGDLLYKRHVRTTRCSRKPWKTRYFAVSERMLYCYNIHPANGGRLIRAMPLEGARIMITPPTDAKYHHMFEVHNLNYFFRMRASSDEVRDKWIQCLEEERDSHTLFPHQVDLIDGSDDESGNHSQKQFMKDLNPSQKTRYDFFKHERDFIRNMTDIAEELRFLEPAERKKVAPTLIEKLPTPPCVYIPLCASTDIWRRVQSSIAKEVRVFNTNERCPVVNYVLTRRGEKMHHHRGGLKDINLDVAEYLHLQYEVPDPTMQPICEMNSVSFEIVEQNGMEKVLPSTSESEEDSTVGKGLVWKDMEEHKDPGLEESESPKEESAVIKGNAQLRKMLKENFVRIPSKIKNRLPTRSPGRKSLLKKNLMNLQSIPILENRSGEEEDERSVVSDVSGTMLTADGGVFQQGEKDGIDEKSLERASQFVCKGESWMKKSERLLKEALENGIIDSDANSEVTGFMIKSNDDVRQEVFVMQMIHFYKSVFAKASLPIWLKTYRILSTSKDTGLIEFLTDSISIDGLKKCDSYPKEGGLRAYFEQVYGDPSGESFQAAQRNFMLSLVGYSLVSYLLGLKDRHNGNIMIDTRGHLIHIDFGFAMGMAPGHEFSFEKAPFKLTQDYIDVMGGLSSPCFREFKRLFVAGLETARANSQIALGLIEIMMYKSKYPCFSGPRYGGRTGLINFQNRLMLKTPERDIRRRALSLIQESLDSRGTWLYDRFQLWSNGYAM